MYSAFKLKAKRQKRSKFLDTVA